MLVFECESDGGKGKLVVHLARYFFKIFLTSYVCGSIALYVIFYIWPHLVMVVRQKQNLAHLGVVDILFALILSPVVESSILVYSIVIFTQIVRNKILACILGALPVAVLHVVIDWRVAVAVIVPFALQGWAYINVRGSIAVMPALIFVAGIHSCMNLMNVAINLYRFSGG